MRITRAPKHCETNFTHLRPLPISVMISSILKAQPKTEFVVFLRWSEQSSVADHPSQTLQQLCCIQHENEKNNVIRIPYTLLDCFAWLYPGSWSVPLAMYSLGILFLVFSFIKAGRVRQRKKTKKKILNCQTFFNIYVNRIT